MYPGIHNFSEIGKLNKVLLHRPGRELEKLTPNNFERLLFDDIPFLKVAQEEHDRFAEVLKENGVEVVYYQHETAKALKDEKKEEKYTKGKTRDFKIIRAIKGKFHAKMGMIKGSIGKS